MDQRWGCHSRCFHGRVERCPQIVARVLQQHHLHPAVCQLMREALGRQRRIEGHVRTAGLQNGDERDGHGAGPFGKHPHQHVGADAVLSPEPMRQLRGATVEGGSGPVTPFMGHTNNGMGCPACHKGGQSVRHKTGQRMRRGIRHRRRVPAGKLRLLVVTEQRHRRHGDGSLIDQMLEQPDHMRAGPLQRCLIEPPAIRRQRHRLRPRYREHQHTEIPRCLLQPLPDRSCDGGGVEFRADQRVEGHGRGVAPLRSKACERHQRQHFVVLQRNGVSRESAEAHHQLLVSAVAARERRGRSSIPCDGSAVTAPFAQPVRKRASQRHTHERSSAGRKHRTERCLWAGRQLMHRQRHLL